MKFKILGSGTSTGVPVPGCTCQICTSGDPKNERTRTSALIILDGGEHILIDAGPDLRYQALKWKIPRVDAILFTHEHSDHILGVDDLRCFNMVNRRAIPCYGTEETLSGIERMFHYLFSKNDDYEGGLLADLTMHRIHHFKPFTVLGLSITPFALYHGSFLVTGFRFGSIAYATDCKSIPHESKELMRGVEHLFLDGLRYKEHRTHLTIPQAVDVATELEAKMTYIVHTSHTVDYHTTNAKLPSHVQLAYDGLEVSFLL